MLLLTSLTQPQPISHIAPHTLAGDFQPAHLASQPLPLSTGETGHCFTVRAGLTRYRSCEHQWVSRAELLTNTARIKATQDTKRRVAVLTRVWNIP